MSGTHDFIGFGHSKLPTFNSHQSFSRVRYTFFSIGFQVLTAVSVVRYSLFLSIFRYSVFPFQILFSHHFSDIFCCFFFGSWFPKVFTLFILFIKFSLRYCHSKQKFHCYIVTQFSGIFKNFHFNIIIILFSFGGHGFFECSISIL